MPDVDIVPKDFECPITLDVMVSPVRTNCLEEKPTTSFFSRIFAPAPDDSFKGHYFERDALAAHFRQNNQNCPTCNRIITKVVPDKNLADRITREFTAKHKLHFEAAKNDVEKTYGAMKDRPIIPNDSDPSVAERAAPEAPAPGSLAPSAERAPRPYRDSFASGLFSHRAFHAHHPLFSALYPRRESDSTKYNKVKQHIRNDNLVLANNEADRIVSAYSRNMAYRDISENYLNKYISRYNVRRSSEHLVSASRVVSKIIDHSMKNNLNYRTVQKAFPNHLVHVEGVACLITNSRLKNMALEPIAKKNITLYLSSSMEARIQDGIRIANTLVTDDSTKQNILNEAINAYIRKDKLKKAINLNNSISSINAQDQNKKDIANQYVNRNFTNANFQKSLTTASQISSMSIKDSTYSLIVGKAASNKAYLKSYKTISKISKFSKRLGLYIKVTCKMLFFGLFKVVSFPFKLTYWGFYYLLAPFRALFKRR